MIFAPSNHVGVEVRQSKQPRQMLDLQARYGEAAYAIGRPDGPIAAMGLRGLNNVDWTVITTWEGEGLRSPTPRPYDLARADTYEVITVDRLDGLSATTIGPDLQAFPFVNVFQVAPGKREQMILYFNKTIETVRIQPGYIATNFMMSLDGLRAVNVGLYDTREEFMAIFRQLPVLRDFAGGAVSGILPTVFGFLPRLPRLKLYELIAAQSAPNEHIVDGDS